MVFAVIILGVYVIYDYLVAFFAVLSVASFPVIPMCKGIWCIVICFWSSCGVFTFVWISFKVLFVVVMYDDITWTAIIEYSEKGVWDVFHFNIKFCFILSNWEEVWKTVNRFLFHSYHFISWTINIYSQPPVWGSTFLLYCRASCLKVVGISLFCDIF